MAAKLPEKIFPLYQKKILYPPLVVPPPTYMAPQSVPKKYFLVKRNFDSNNYKKDPYLFFEAFGRNGDFGEGGGGFASVPKNSNSFKKSQQ